MLTVLTSGRSVEFLTNNKAQEKFLKEKNQRALMRIIFRMYKLQAHTWHSAQEATLLLALYKWH